MFGEGNEKLNTLTTVSNSSKETSLTQIIPVFLLLRQGNLPQQVRRYEEFLYQFAKIINNESVETLRQIDEFFSQIIANYEFDEVSIIRDIIEQFCVFLVSRQYISNNPFSQPPTGNSLNSNISCQGNISPVLQINPNETTSFTNVLQFKRESTPNPDDTYMPNITSPTSLTNVTPSLADITTTPVLKKPPMELIHDFLKESKSFGDYRQPNTIATYEGGLRGYASYCEKSNFAFLSNQSLKDYLSFLSEIIQKNGRKLSTSTIQGRKACLRAFIKYGIKNHWFLMSDEYQDILIIKKRERTPQEPHLALTLDETTQLFKYAVSMNSTQSMLEIVILLICGARRMEIVTLKKANYDLANHRIHLTVTKNGRERYIPLPEFIVKLLGEILHSFGNQDYTFPTRQAKAMCEKTLTEHIKKTASLAGLNRKVTSHDLRATYATLQYYHGDVKLVDLKDYMGHDDINTTANYISREKKLNGKNRISLDDIYQEWETALLSRIQPEI